ncbi:MAG TPA: phosphoenolpyruvate carboxykinase (ATP), partial [Pyrinomonadaceae bacterium]|nr:phosphoenolpyruvate carboxykinase (ATP) [Pyrinomonadaceae bacterium]
MTAIKMSAAREHGRKRTGVGLDALGISAEANVFWNLNTPELYEEIARRGEGIISAHGALIVDTGEHTGRAAKDKAIVREPSSEDKVFWGEVNKDFPQEKFDRVRDRMMKYAGGRDLFVQDTYAGADAHYRLPVRIITELAWHSLFARTMFINDDEGREKHTPEFTVVNIPSFKADPATDGTRSETFILMDFKQRLVLIGGTSYAGETKKSVFTILNYLLPQRGVMSMHCSANVGDAGDVAIFFGLSGTGKTTL